VFSIPALIALTRARLSFRVRPFTEGTVIGGFLAAECFPAPDSVLDAVLGRIGDSAAATGTICGVGEPAIRALVATASPPGEGGRASLVAAQASAVARVNEISMGMDDNLWETYCISSTEELLGFAAFVAIGGIYLLG